PRELDEVVPGDVLGDDGAFGADEGREPDRVVATAGANIANRHAWLQLKKTGDLAGLIQGITVPLVGAARADNRRNRALRRGKLCRGSSWRRQITNVGGVCANCAEPYKKRHCSGQRHHVSVSHKTMIASPRC